MGLLSALAISALIQVPKPSSKVEVVAQAQAIATKLTSKTERGIAFLVIAQAQNSLGSKNAAILSLDTGWNSWQKGTDDGVTEGDRTDFQTLVDQNDLSLVPCGYAEQYLIAGSKAKALAVAETLGDSRLGEAFRHGLGIQIRDRFPDAFEELAFTKAVQAQRKAKRESLLVSVGDARHEQDVMVRAGKLYHIADELLVLGDPGDALRLLREAVELTPQFPDALMRITFEAQGASGMWQMGAKADAKVLIAHASSMAATAMGDKEKVLRAKFAVEQTKRTMDLPNNLADVTRQMDGLAGVIPAPKSKVVPDGSIYSIISEATVLHESGKDAQARKVLDRLKVVSKSPIPKDGWWRILLAELQLDMGDRAPAKANLTLGGKQFVSLLPAAKSMPTESLIKLDRIAQDLVKAWDRPGAVKLIQDGVAKLAAGSTFTKLMHTGDDGDHLVIHDRRSPILHWGAEAIARAGDFRTAVTMANSVPHPAHRAIALAGVVRDSAIIK